MTASSLVLGVVPVLFIWAACRLRDLDIRRPDDRSLTDGQHRFAERQQWNRQNGFQAATFLASLIAAGLGYGAFRSAQTQADVAQKALVLSDRPWLEVSVTPTVINVTETKISVSINVRVTNVGRSPAVNVEVQDRVQSSFTTDNKFFYDPNNFCYLQRKYPEFPFGITLFPSRDFIREEKPSVDVADFNQIRIQRSKDNDADFVPLSVVGCVSYRISGTQSIHQTTFALELYSKSGISRWFIAKIFPATIYSSDFEWRSSEGIPPAD